ncbi:CDK-activating kinase assembly factor [Brevipalpus obovatus]|uniref:CDK-activating kinase assembly factor n=1 Tax=Brevipalpus obovatus TaxID=246614 RepID=UPI003D9E2EC0
MSDDLSCPECKTTKYRNPSLKLLVNVCGHSLCEKCVDLIFIKGTASCPQCGISLRKTKFRLQVFQDATVEKEVDIRKRVLKDFNKKEDDFASLAEYNDYLEFIETIVYNLTYDIDVEETKRKIEQYKKENSETIVKNRSKISRDEEEIESLLEFERERDRWRTHTIEKEALEVKKAKARSKEALVDELICSNLPASEILANHLDERMSIETKQAEPPKPPPIRPPVQAIFSTGIKVGKGSNVFLPLPKKTEYPAYSYIKPSFDVEGPSLPPIEKLQSDGYLNHVRGIDAAEKAGGYLPIYPCYRALQEAFCGLFYDPDS